jgi:hypothetical protein
MASKSTLARMIDRERIGVTWMQVLDDPYWSKPPLSTS